MYVWTLAFSKISLLLCCTSEDYGLESLMCEFVAKIYGILKSYRAGNFVLTDNEAYAKTKTPNISPSGTISQENPLIHHCDEFC